MDPTVEASSASLATVLAGSAEMQRDVQLKRMKNLYLPFNQQIYMNSIYARLVLMTYISKQLHR